MKIKNYLLIVLFAVFFVGCASSTSYQYSANKVVLGKNENLVNLDFTNPIFQRQASFCTTNSYTLSDENIKYGYLFIESIELSNGCNWNGLPSSFLESSIKDELNLFSLKTVEEYDIDGYNFKTLKVNDDSYINLIYIYNGNKDRFILDSYGRLYDKLLKSFKPDYENKYFAKKRFLGKYNNSLVRKNLIYRYFEAEKIKLSSQLGIILSF